MFMKPTKWLSLFAVLIVIQAESPLHKFGLNEKCSPPTWKSSICSHPEGCSTIFEKSTNETIVCPEGRTLYAANDRASKVYAIYSGNLSCFHGVWRDDSSDDVPQLIGSEISVACAACSPPIQMARECDEWTICSYSYVTNTKISCNLGYGLYEVGINPSSPVKIDTDLMCVSGNWTGTSEGKSVNINHTKIVCKKTNCASVTDRNELCNLTEENCDSTKLTTSDSEVACPENYTIVASPNLQSGGQLSSPLKCIFGYWNGISGMADQYRYEQLYVTCQRTTCNPPKPMDTFCGSAKCNTNYWIESEGKCSDGRNQYVSATREGYELKSIDEFGCSAGKWSGVHANGQRFFKDDIFVNCDSTCIPPRVSESCSTSDTCFSPEITGDSVTCPDANYDMLMVNGKRSSQLTCDGNWKSKSSVHKRTEELEVHCERATCIQPYQDNTICKESERCSSPFIYVQDSYVYCPEDTEMVVSSGVGTSAIKVSGSLTCVKGIWTGISSEYDDIEADNFTIACISKYCDFVTLTNAVCLTDSCETDYVEQTKDGLVCRNGESLIVSKSSKSRGVEIPFGLQCVDGKWTGHNEENFYGDRVYVTCESPCGNLDSSLSTCSDPNECVEAVQTEATISCESEEYQLVVNGEKSSDLSCKNGEWSESGRKDSLPFQSSVHCMKKTCSKPNLTNDICDSEKERCSTSFLSGTESVQYCTDESTLVVTADGGNIIAVDSTSAQLTCVNGIWTITGFMNDFEAENIRITCKATKCQPLTLDNSACGSKLCDSDFVLHFANSITCRNGKALYASTPLDETKTMYKSVLNCVDGKWKGTTESGFDSYIDEGSVTCDASCIPLYSSTTTCPQLNACTEAVITETTVSCPSNEYQLSVDEYMSEGLECRKGEWKNAEGSTVTSKSSIYCINTTCSSPSLTNTVCDKERCSTEELTGDNSKHYCTDEHVLIVSKTDTTHGEKLSSVSCSNGVWTGARVDTNQSFHAKDIFISCSATKCNKIVSNNEVCGSVSCDNSSLAITDSSVTCSSGEPVFASTSMEQHSKRFETGLKCENGKWTGEDDFYADNIFVTCDAPCKPLLSSTSKCNPLNNCTGASITESTISCPSEDYILFVDGEQSDKLICAHGLWTNSNETVPNSASVHCMKLDCEHPTLSDEICDAESQRCSYKKAVYRKSLVHCFDDEILVVSQNGTVLGQKLSSNLTCENGIWTSPIADSDELFRASAPSITCLATRCFNAIPDDSLCDPMECDVDELIMSNNTISCNGTGPLFVAPSGDNFSLPLFSEIECIDGMWTSELENETIIFDKPIFMTCKSYVMQIEIETSCSVFFNLIIPVLILSLLL